MQYHCFAIYFVSLFCKLVEPKLHQSCFRIVYYMNCIVSIHLYSASCSGHQSEALPVRETQREESSLQRTKRGTLLTSEQSGSIRRMALVPMRRANDCKGSCLSQRSPRSLDKKI